MNFSRLFIIALLGLPVEISAAGGEAIFTLMSSEGFKIYKYMIVQFLVLSCVVLLDELDAWITHNYGHLTSFDFYGLMKTELAIFGIISFTLFTFTVFDNDVHYDTILYVELAHFVLFFLGVVFVLRGVGILLQLGKKKDEMDKIFIQKLDTSNRKGWKRVWSNIQRYFIDANDLEGENDDFDFSMYIRRCVTNDFRHQLHLSAKVWFAALVFLLMGCVEIIIVYETDIEGAGLSKETNLLVATIPFIVTEWLFIFFGLGFCFWEVQWRMKEKLTRIFMEDGIVKWKERKEAELMWKEEQVLWQRKTDSKTHSKQTAKPKQTSKPQATQSEQTPNAPNQSKGGLPTINSGQEMPEEALKCDRSGDDGLSHSKHSQPKTNRYVLFKETEMIRSSDHSESSHIGPVDAGDVDEFGDKIDVPVVKWEHLTSFGEHTIPFILQSQAILNCFVVGTYLGLYVGPLVKNLEEVWLNLLLAALVFFPTVMSTFWLIPKTLFGHSFMLAIVKPRLDEIEKSRERARKANLGWYKVASSLEMDENGEHVALPSIGARKDSKFTKTEFKAWLFDQNVSLERREFHEMWRYVDPAKTKLGSEELLFHCLLKAEKNLVLEVRVEGLRKYEQMSQSKELPIPHPQKSLVNSIKIKGIQSSMAKNAFNHRFSMRNSLAVPVSIRDLASQSGIKLPVEKPTMSFSVDDQGLQSLI